MTMETKQLHALSKVYLEAVYGGAKKEAPKDTRLTVTNADKKANTKAYQNYKAGNKAYKAADHLKNEDAQYGYDKKGNSLNPVDIEKKKRKKDDLAGAPMKEGKKAAKDYDGDGKIESGKAEYFGSKDKAIKKAMKKEGFSNWRHDLKEIPDYDQIPETTKDRNKKIEEKKVKNSVKINPTMEEETQVDEGVYEKQKTKEVMGALKKRDLKKDVKKKIAADIVKKKGDTSKSDDRYAYEDKTWEDIADELNESDIADIIARLEKKRISKGGNPDDSPLPSMKKYHADKKKKAGK